MIKLLKSGEAETIVQADELNVDGVLIDDLKARKIAKLRGLKVIGTIGILVDAKEKGVISELKPVGHRLRSFTCSTNIVL